MLPISLHGRITDHRVSALALCCEEKGVGYCLLDDSITESKTGRPLLTHQGQSLTEPLAALYYLNEGMPGPDLMPDSPWSRALVLQLCQRLLASHPPEASEIPEWCTLPLPSEVGFVVDDHLTLADLSLFAWSTACGITVLEGPMDLWWAAMRQRESVKAIWGPN
ncbi:hypothetical protein [Ferrimonas gelatinilytica]|uniref:Glutathione S-transferase n=1 Tax=Ferrimonas gelatinilytica TaxID=1255257 RepID=A0ABP9RW82_9GAMM